MATTIDYASDYDRDANDYQTTMAENPSGTIDYDSLTRGKLCPLKHAGSEAACLCDGSRCAWWDADKARCAVLSLARNK